MFRIASILLLRWIPPGQAEDSDREHWLTMWPGRHAGASDVEPVPSSFNVVIRKMQLRRHVFRLKPNLKFLP